MAGARREPAKEIVYYVISMENGQTVREYKATGRPAALSYLEELRALEPHRIHRMEGRLE